MTEHELRALVRDAVVRHLGPRATGAAPPPVSTAVPARVASAAPGHASHGIYISLVNADDSCVIEPAIRCSHCSYCKSHGH